MGWIWELFKSQFFWLILAGLLVFVAYKKFKY